MAFQQKDLVPVYVPILGQNHELGESLQPDPDGYDGRCVSFLCIHLTSTFISWIPFHSRFHVPLLPCTLH